MAPQSKKRLKRGQQSPFDQLRSICLDMRPSWKAVAEILRDAYLLIAPRKLRAQMRQ